MSQLTDGDDEIVEALRAGIAAERGYADFDTWGDRRVKELGIGRDFAEAFRREFARDLCGIRNSLPDQDPPDLIADGGIGIEVTELVDQALVKEAVGRKRKGIRIRPYRDWRGGDLVSELRRIIERKDGAELKAPEALREYFLVVHTDEPGLTPGLVEHFLGDWYEPRCGLIDRAFLLLSYFPSHNGRPLYELSLESG